MNARGEGRYFADIHDVRHSFEAGLVELHAKIHVRLAEEVMAEDGNYQKVFKRFETTVGRALLSEILPQGMSFKHLNKTMTKKAISRAIDSSYRNLGLKATVIFADQLMYTGFQQATKAGVSIGINDMAIPEDKAGIIANAEGEVKEIEAQYASGLVTNGERYNKVVDIWSRTNDLVAKAMMDKISHQFVKDKEGNEVKQESFNSIYMMADSGARGSAAQIRQLAGMRGLMAKPDGSIIETPITANFREGLKRTPVLHLYSRCA